MIWWLILIFDYVHFSLSPFRNEEIEIQREHAVGIRWKSNNVNAFDPRLFLPFFCSVPFSRDHIWIYLQFMTFVTNSPGRWCTHSKNSNMQSMCYRSMMIWCNCNIRCLSHWICSALFGFVYSSVALLFSWLRYHKLRVI